MFAQKTNKSTNSKHGFKNKSCVKHVFKQNKNQQPHKRTTTNTCSRRCQHQKQKHFQKLIPNNEQPIQQQKQTQRNNKS